MEDEIKPIENLETQKPGLDHEKALGYEKEIENEPFALPKKKSGKKIYLILALLLIVAVVVAGAIFWKPKVSVKVKQTGAQVKLDKNIITQKVKVKPGKHTIIVTKKGFVPYTYQDSLKPFQTLDFEVDLRPLPEPKVIIEEKAFEADFVSGGDKFYYLGNNGKTIYQVGSISKGSSNKATLEKIPITLDNLAGLDRVIFPPKYDIAMFKKKDGDSGLFDFMRYDLINQTYKSWGANIGDAVWSPDGEKIAYYFAPPNGEKPIIISNRAHTDIFRARDLRDADISVGANEKDSPILNWSKDGKAISIVVQGKLLILNVSTGDLTEVQAKGVTSARFSPDSAHLLYTLNGKLIWQKYEIVDGLTGKKDDQIEVGKVRVGDAEKINLTALAKDSVFTKNNDNIIVIAKEGLKKVRLDALTISPFYLATTLQNIINLGLSDDLSVLYVLTDNKILAVPLDNGTYQSEKK